MYIRSEWIYGLFPEGFPCLLVPPPSRRNAALTAPTHDGHASALAIIPLPTTSFFHFFLKNYNLACP